MANQLRRSMRSKYPIATTRSSDPTPQLEDPMDYEEEEMTLASFVSMKKKEIAEGKKKMGSSSNQGSAPLIEKTDEHYYGGSSSEEDVPETEIKEEEEIVGAQKEAPLEKKRMRKWGSKRHHKNMISMFMGMSFVGTRYPHHETMKELSIHTDWTFLIKQCKLDTFFTYKLESYKEETCHFLATLDVHLYTNEEESDQEDEGLGYITFLIRGQPFRLTFEALDKLFGFPSGTEITQDFDKDELNQIWQIVSGESNYSSSRSKSSNIGNPAMRYFHKSIANTFFARGATGTINEGELRFLDLALKDLLNETSSHRIMEGDRSNTSLTAILLDQLLHYKEWGLRMKTLGTKGELCIGGVITPILYACGVEITSRPVEPRYMDAHYLTKTHFLDGMKDNGKHLYRFRHPNEGNSMLTLPAPQFTKMRKGKNISFNPPTDYLFRSSAQGDQAATPHSSHTSGAQAPMPSNLRMDEAEKRIGVLEKLSKWQKKTIKGLKNTVKEMRGQIRELQNIVSCSTTKPDAQGPIPMERSRSSSAATRTHTSVDTPRSSTSKRRRQRAGSHSHSITRLDQLIESDAPLDQPRSSPQIELGVPNADCSPTQGDCNATIQLDLEDEPSTQANYTKESMDEAISSFFSKP